MLARENPRTKLEEELRQLSAEIGRAKTENDKTKLAKLLQKQQELIDKLVHDYI